MTSPGWTGCPAAWERICSESVCATICSSSFSMSAARDVVRPLLLAYAQRPRRIQQQRVDFARGQWRAVGTRLDLVCNRLQRLAAKLDAELTGALGDGVPAGQPVADQHLALAAKDRRVDRFVGGRLPQDRIRMQAGLVGERRLTRDAGVEGHLDA